MLTSRVISAGAGKFDVLILCLEAAEPMAGPQTVLLQEI